MAIERADWGDGESRAVVVADQLQADHPSADLGPTLGDEWARSGGEVLNEYNAAYGVEMVLAELHPDDRQTFADGFDALPETAQGVIFSEIALDADSFTRSVSDADLAAFRASDIGDLADEWRGKAGRNLGIVRQRINRTLERMPAGDAEAAANWFDGLAPDAARAVLRMLVA